MGPALTATNNMSDPLPTSIPHLEPNRSNWAIFSMHFQEVMEANRSGDTLMARPYALSWPMPIVTHQQGVSCDVCVCSAKSCQEFSLGIHKY